MAVDSVGTIFIADQYNSRIRKVFLNGSIATVAGNGMAAFAGDGGLAINAQVNEPAAISVDKFGNFYNRIRKVFFNGTIVGNGVGFAGDGGPAIRKVLVNGTITTVTGNGVGGIAGDKSATWGLCGFLRKYFHCRHRKPSNSENNGFSNNKFNFNNKHRLYWRCCW